MWWPTQRVGWRKTEKENPPGRWGTAAPRPLNTDRSKMKGIHRLILAHGWKGEVNRVHGIIKDLCQYLKISKREGTLLHTCGGFLQICLYGLDHSWEDALNRTIKHQDTIQTINRIKSLAKFFDIFSFGVDAYDTYSEYHVEFVFVFDLQLSRLINITGKSHPVQSQRSWLIKAPLESHFLRMGKKRMLILGCHDLHMYSPRAIANIKKGTDSYKRIRKMNRLTNEFNPDIILQHPHTTDSIRIWNLPWRNLERQFPGVQYSGAGKYYNYPGKQRSSLAKIIKSDCSTDVSTIVRYKNGKLIIFSGE
jgi:hypothetical protein